jgi:hypothetical protein
MNPDGTPGEPGNSLFYSDDPDVIEVTGGAPVQFDSGAVNFKDFRVVNPATGEPVSVEIQYSTQSVSEDYDAADEALAKELNDANADSATEVSAEDIAAYRRALGLTWHHDLDMQTMDLVPTNLNNGVAHTGGAALFRALQRMLGGK